ncbi:hypothetical protein G9A89_007750 [Geosiphon pyriformis]|nr:hypothetical protein G9A89_007750 [Geosiphon pyriformis]
MFTYPIPINNPRKVHLFGIQDEAVREQINYVLDENEIIGKGPNGTLSMVFNGIKRLNKGEKHLKITCDNAGVLTPPPLDYKRQEYLYQNIRAFVRDKFKDITCPKPVQNGFE